MERCDLCGDATRAALLELPRARSMRSDQVLVDLPLCKLECPRCGLVRSASSALPETLYADDYGVGLKPDHVFHIPQGPRTRSTVFAEWMVEVGGTAPWEAARSVLEVGAGSGALANELKTRFPQAAFQCVEPGARAALAARGAFGLEVVRHLDELPGAATFDLIYAVAVLEHVQSPTGFLQGIASRLRPGGLVFLTQPTQDVPSYDLFFVDHLHHFGSGHVAQLAQKCGLRERALRVGHPLMPNFSLHVLEKLERPAPFEPHHVSTQCRAIASGLPADMRRLDGHLAELDRSGRPWAPFGMGEVFWLALAYSDLGTRSIRVGLADDLEHPDLARLPFEVVRPEDAPTLGVREVLLTMNRVYYPRVCERIRALGMNPFELLHASA